MTQFEFILLPLSMIAAIAVGKILTSWALVVKNWGRTKNRSLYLSFSVWLVFNLLFGHFGGLWLYRELEFTTLITFLVLLPTLLSSLSMAILSLSDFQEDLDEHYFKYQARSVTFALAALITSTLTDLIPGAPFFVGILAPITITAVAMLAMLISTSKHVHIAAHGILWIIWIFFLVVNHVYA